MRSQLFSVLHSVRRDRHGVAALEFALVGTIMVTVVLAAYDLGNAAQQQIQLQEGVRAGGVYAQSFPQDTTGIVNAVKAGLPSGWTDVTVTGPTFTCDCLTASTGATTANDCSTACPNGTQLERYLSLTASRPYSPLMFKTITQNSATHVERYQ